VVPRDENFPAQISTRVAFLIAGIGFSSLAPLIPGIKVHLALDDRRLGLLLLWVGLGSIMVMPFAGRLAAKFGCRKVIVASALALCASLPLLAMATNTYAVAGALFLMGAGGGTLDVVMNIQAVVVEQNSKRSMMSGFHGLFSVGEIVGAGGVTMLLSLNFSPILSLTAVALGCVGMLGAATPNFLPYRKQLSEIPSRSFTLPRGKVLLIGVLCFIVFMGEGSITDWSGVLLMDFRNVSLNHAGLGYVAFASMMTLVRLTGDFVVTKLGRKAVMLGGCLCAASGFIISATVPNMFASIIGFGLVGIGLANVVPILFTASGKQDTMPANLALSSVTTMGYLGLLVGPPVLGFIAHQTTLLISLGLLGALCLLVAACTNLVTRSQK
jgi:MFS family permease